MSVETQSQHFFIINHILIIFNYINEEYRIVNSNRAIQLIYAIIYINIKNIHKEVIKHEFIEN